MFSRGRTWASGLSEMRPPRENSRKPGPEPLGHRDGPKGARRELQGASRQVREAPRDLQEASRQTQESSKRPQDGCKSTQAYSRVQSSRSVFVLGGNVVFRYSFEAFCPRSAELRNHIREFKQCFEASVIVPNLSCSAESHSHQRIQRVVQGL